MVRLLLFLALVAAALLLVRGGGEGLRRWLSRYGRQAAISLAALAYLLSPIDLVPDLGPVGIADDLLVLLAAWWWLAAKEAKRPRPQAQADNERAGSAGAGAEAGHGGPQGAQEARAWDPWAVLGVKPGSSHEEIARAYREQMKRYHPDRVADLGPELQELAHRKAIEIHRAWEELRFR